MEAMKEHTELVKAVKAVKEALTDLELAYNADERLKDMELCPMDLEEDLENVRDILEDIDSIVSREYTALYVK